VDKESFLVLKSEGCNESRNLERTMDIVLTTAFKDQRLARF